MDVWTIGAADRLRFPRLLREFGRQKMLAFAQISTAAVTNKGLDIDDAKSVSRDSGMCGRPHRFETALLEWSHIDHRPRQLE